MKKVKNMKPDKPRLELITEYQLAPDEVLFSQITVAALRNCSIATIERDRWAGTGVPFIKMGGLVRYRKIDIQNWLIKQPIVQFTAQAKQLIYRSG